MTANAAEPTVSVRLATDADLEILEAREGEAARGSSREALQRQKDGDFFLVVGLLDEQIAGRVILDCSAENELRPEMKLLWVYPEARRRGLGASMTSFMEDLAASMGFDEIFLGVTPDNPAAIPLYIGLDYTPTGEHRSAVNLAVIEPEAIVPDDEPTEAIFRKSLRIRRR